MAGQIRATDGVLRRSRQHLQVDVQGEKTRGTTRFSRAAHELGIELILAGGPQAKGRVKRSHGTHRDRWVKLLRLGGATTRAEANELVDRKLLADHYR